MRERSSSQTSVPMVSRPIEQFNQHPLKTTNCGHVVDAVAFSNDGQTLVTGGWNEKVVLYTEENDDLKEKKVIDRSKFIRTVATSPKRPIFAVGGNDNKVALYDINTGFLLKQFNEDERIRTVAFSPDGDKLAVGGRNKLVKLYSVPTLSLQRKIERTDLVFAVAFSPDGNQLAVGGDDKTVALYAVNSDKPPTEKIWPRASIRAVAFLPKGTNLAVGGHDNCVAVYDVRTFERLCEIRRRDHIYALAVSPDEKTLAVGGHDRMVALYDIATFEQRSTTIKCKEKVRTVAFKPNTDTLAVGCWDGEIALYDVAISMQRVEEIQRSEWVNSVVFSPEGNVLAVGGEDKQVALYDIAKSAEMRSETIRRTHNIRTLAFSPDGEILAVGGEDGKVALYDVRRSLRNPEPEWTYCGVGIVHAVAFSPDSKKLAVGGNDKSVLVYNCSNFRSPPRIIERSDVVRTVAFSLDSTRLAVGGEDREVALYDVAHAGNSPTKIKRGSTVRIVTFSPDRKTLAMGGDDKEVAFYDISTGEDRSGKIACKHAVRSIAFSPDGKALAVGGNDVSLYDAVTAKLLFEVHLRRHCHRVAFCPPTHARNHHPFVLAISMDSLVSLVEIRENASLSLPVDWLLEHAKDDAAVLAATEPFHQAATSRDANGLTLLARAILERRIELAAGLVSRDPAHAFDESAAGIFNLLVEHDRRPILHRIFGFEGIIATTAVTQLEEMSRTLLKLAENNITASVAKALEAGGKGTKRGFMRVPPEIFLLTMNDKPVNRKLPPRATACHMPVLKSDSKAVDGDKDRRLRWPGVKEDKKKQVRLALLRVVLPDLHSFEALKSLTSMDSYDAFASESLRSVIDSQWSAWARRRFHFQCFLYFSWLVCLTTLSEVAFEKKWLSRQTRSIRYALEGGVLLGVYYFGRREVKQACKLGNKYIWDMWNWRQWAGLGASLCFVIVEFVKPRDENTIAVVGAATHLLVASGLLHYARGFDGTASIVRTLLAIACDMIPFVVVLFLGIITFAFALRALFSNEKRADECYFEEDGALDCDERQSGFSSLWKSFVTTMYAAVFGDFDIDVIYELAENRVLALVVTTLMLLATLLIALNALISLMSESFGRISKIKHAVLAHQKAKLILELYCDMSQAERKDIERRYRWTYVLLPEAELDDDNGIEIAELMRTVLALSTSLARRTPQEAG